MSIKIKKDGQVREFILPATNIQVLDIADKFKKKDLENVIKEISDTEHIYIGEVDETKDGIWIDDGEILDNAENNGVVERIKEYVDGQIKDYSNPNLLVNGDFRVNTKGKESFTEQNTETINKWLSTFADTEHITVDRHYNNDSNSYYMRVTFTEIGANKAGSNLHQILEDTANGYSIVAGKTVTFSADCYATTSARCIFIGYTTNRGASFEYAIEPIIKDVDKKRYKITTTIPVNATLVHCGLGMCRLIDDTMVGQYADIYNAKFEIGEYATPFVPKSYSEELLACKDGIIGSNPNLLINGGFQVWQRGAGFAYRGDIANQRNIYTADRWRFVQSADDVMCSINQYRDLNGMYFGISNLSKASTTNITLHQKLEPWHLQTGVYTLSYEYANTGNMKFNSRIYSFGRRDNIITSQEYQPDGSGTWSKGILVFEITAQDISNIIEIDFDMGAGELHTNGTFYLRNVKLEKSSVATPFVPKTYSQELADCKRYYEKVVDSHGFATCYGYGTNTVRCITRYLPKRISPTVTISALSTFVVEIGNSNVVPTGYAAQDFDSYGNGYFIFNVPSVTNGLAGRIKRSDNGTAYIEYDAEIY